MKILLCNPPCRIKIDQDHERYFIRGGSRWPYSDNKKITENITYSPFPFYLAYTSSIIKNQPNVELFAHDSIALNDTEADFIKIFKQTKPDLILFETATGTLNNDLKLLQKIKKISPKVIVCLAGFHVSSLIKESFTFFGKNLDYLLLREYENNFSDLVAVLNKHQDVGTIKGLAYKSGKKIIINDNGELVDVNKLPFPDRQSFPSNVVKSNFSVYWDGFCQYQPAIQMHASRGCPFHCNFCAWTQIMYRSGKYRPRNPASICDEIESVIRDFNAKEVYFDDDTFTGNKVSLMALCQEMIKRKLHQRIHWSAMADFMVTDKEMIEKMKESGCVALKFGVESGNQEVLRKIGKPINFQKINDNCRLCSKLKIKTHATFTFGLSGETKQTLQDTLKASQSIDCDSIQFSITTPFPGTSYYRELEKEKRLNFKQWSDFDGSNSSVVKFEDFSNSYLMDFYRQTNILWLKAKIKDPNWIYRRFYYLFRTIKGRGLSFGFYTFNNLLTKIFRWQ